MPLANIMSNMPVREENAAWISAKSLVEAIILQAIEDLWSDAYRNESIKFFMGEGFNSCTEIAGMSPDEQIKLVMFVSRSVRNSKKMSIKR